MTRGLVCLFRYLTVVGRTSRRVSFSSRMPKRPAQSPFERETKASQLGPSTGSLHADRLSCPDDRSARSSDSDGHARPSDEMTEATIGDDDRVEYLETPVKSETDEKEYRIIRLPNKLTALLIADIRKSDFQGEDYERDAASSEYETEDDESEEDDEEDEEDEKDETDDESGSDDDEDDENCTSAARRIREKKTLKREAACALCVGVGSFSDPPEIPGMAHFLEHMVFMGSEKYPEENDFDAFITKRGGSDNASTECELTTFHFDIQGKYLFSALDRFAQFFIKPLMKKDTISREREAVESEFQLALPSDSYRKEQLLASLARPNHPARKFSWGNLVTLRDNISDDKLYEELHKFRERHYSAHRMTLVIQARLTLDTLEKYVKTCFADIPNNELPPDDFSEFKGADSFDAPNFRRIYKIKPVKDICQVELTWVMPPLHDLYKSKPHDYVSWIIGHEGKGSLISYLRKKMWCLDIFSGNSESGFDHSSMYALFRLALVFTDEGLEHLEEVLNAIFSFINLMKREGPHKRIFDEIQQIEDNNFRYTNEQRPVDYVEDLSECMHFYPPRDYITGSELYFEYNPDAIRNCLNYLVPDNVNIVIFDKRFNDEEFDKVEPWFHTKYLDIEIPSEWIERWKTIEPLTDFHLPLPNIFLISDFSLIQLPANILEYPVKVYSDEVSEIWYRPDPKFRLPECFINIFLISPLPFISAKNAVLMDLYVCVLQLLLVEELYPAAAAALNHCINPNEKGIVLSVNGYNEKLPLMLMTIMKYVADYPNLLRKELFDVLKEQMIKEYYNTSLKPEKFMKDVGLAILKVVHWSIVDKHAATREIEFDDFVNFVTSFTEHLYIQCLVQGNIMQDVAVENVRRGIEMLKCGPLLPGTIPQTRITEIPLGSQYCKLKNFNRIDVNSMVTNYYQAGITSDKLSAIIDLVIMIMEEPLFHQLRTKEQLGYDVCCNYRDVEGILGYSVTVFTQDKHNTDYVDERIEKFLNSFIKLLDEMTEEELKTIKQDLIKAKQCADVHLKEEFNRNWNEIVWRDYMFNRLEREVLAIKDIKIDELRDWVTRHTLNGSNLRKLSMHIVGTKSKKKSAKKDDVEHTEASNAMEDCRKAKYVYEYISDNSQREKTGNVLITDIKDFKQHLNVYPAKHDAL